MTSPDISADGKKDLLDKRVVINATVETQIDFALIIHETYRPRTDSRGRYRFVRGDTGLQVTFPRLDYVTAQRDICTLILGRPLYGRRLLRPLEAKHPTKTRCHPQVGSKGYLNHLRSSSNADDRALAKYLEVCQRMSDRRAIADSVSDVTESDSGSVNPEL